jgi:hypothetical protein
MAGLQISQPIGEFLGVCQSFLDEVNREQARSLTPLELVLLATYVRQLGTIIEQRSALTTA